MDGRAQVPSRALDEERRLAVPRVPPPAPGNGLRDDHGDHVVRVRRLDAIEGRGAARQGGMRAVSGRRCRRAAAPRSPDIVPRRGARHAEGVSLVETLVALAATGLLLAGSLTLLVQGQRAWVDGAARVEAQQAARVALLRLASDLRQAGRGMGWTGAVLTVAEGTRLALRVDADGDGAATGPGETITWRLVGGVLRRSAGAGAQPVINGVESLAFAYVDAAGRPTSDPGAVRLVTITLTTRAGRPGAGGVTTVTTRVRLRNR